MKKITFEWTDGRASLNSCGTRALRDNGIDFYYRGQVLHAMICGREIQIGYKHIAGDTWEIVERTI